MGQWHCIKELYIYACSSLIARSANQNGQMLASTALLEVKSKSMNESSMNSKGVKYRLKAPSLGILASQQNIQQPGFAVVTLYVCTAHQV